MKNFLLIVSVLLSSMTFAQGHETFDNLGLTGNSYQNGSFVGQDGIEWTYGQSRGDIELDGAAITLGSNRNEDMYLESAALTNGVGTLEFSYSQAFSNPVNLEVLVDGVLVYTATSDNEQGVIKSSGLITVEAEAGAVIKFNNPNGAQVTLDNIIWTAFDSGGGGGEVCSQGTESNDIENGWGNVSLLTYANDFIVAQNEEFTLEQFSVNFLLNPGQPIVSADIFFYEDTGGNGPGAEIPGTSSLGVVPDSQQAIGSHPAGFDLIQGVWTLATPVTFEGNASGETIYWMGIQIEYAGANAFMETSSVYDTPNEAYFTEDGGATWTSGLANFGADMHGVVTFSGQCEIVDGGGGGDVVYCTPMLDCTDGDMITNVTFQEINNTTTCSPNGYGDYTDMVAVVEAGETYSISVSVGDGWSSESVSVWIDFDNSESFDQNEFFYIGTGSDEALTGNIEIPAEVAEGNYRMRVRVAAVGEATATWDMACDETQGYGETEDYTIEVNNGDIVNDYCIPVGINSTRYINNFATTGASENISNLGSGFSTGGYGDFTGMKVKQVQTNDVDFTVGIEGGTAGFRVWVDWNQDGVFDVTEEVAYQSSSYSGSHAGSFMIPEDATPGETRMRIVSHWLSSSGDIDPCATGFDYGEFEDYTLEVVALEACSEAIAGTVVGDTEMVVCANAPFSMSVEGNSEPASGLTRTWQSSPAGDNTWTDLGQSSSTITIAGISEPMDYRYHVACENGDSDDSEVISVSLNPNTDECYCIPEGTNSGRYIDNFSTTDGTENISNMGSGYSAFGYGDFYDTHTIAQEQGETVEFSVDIVGGIAGFRIWVDWNQDGSFDATEEVAYSSSGYSANHTGTITVPADAVEGDTRMRIVSHWLSTSGDIDPCEVGFTYGEFEDYKFTVEANSGGGDDEDCAQGDDSNGFENGLNITAGGTFRNADDFIVSPNNTLNVQSIELNIFADGPITNIDVNFYNDENGAPGATVVESVTGLVPYAQVPIGTEFGYTVYAVYVEVDLEFVGGATGTTYWMQPEAQVATAFWEVTTLGTLGAPIHTSESLGAWVADEDGAHAVFKLHCDVATPPDSECLFDITSTVEPITRVVMNNVDNASSVNSDIALEDFTDIIIMAEAGASYDVAFEGYTGGNFTNYFTLFVDLSVDQDWSDFEAIEIGTLVNSTGTDGQQATANITIPSNFPEGQYNLRVIKNFGSSPLDPCAAYTWGQGEDYTLMIGELDDCSGTPDAGVASVNPESGNINTTYTVSAVDYSFGNGMTYQWQSNTDGAGWENEGDLLDQYASHTATAPAEYGVSVEWRLEVTCTLSSETSYSETATFTTEMTYCTPMLDCADGDMITNVNFQEIDNTTTCSPDGYGDYTDMVATVQAGGTYPISVSVGDGWTSESVSVWIDFDNNGSFDEDEFYFIGTGSGEALLGDIAIPADAANGDYRMRVRVAAVGADTATWDMSCDEDQFYGETEDYTVTVDGVVGMDDHSAVTFSYYPNPMGDVLYITSSENVETISAYNVIGQEVLSSKKLVDGKVNVSTLPSGAYMFRVTFENGFTENFKVLKK